MRRVDPESIRHLRLDPATQTAVVREIRLPAAVDEAHKYVREAVVAYPELYFARLVMLVEGDSEEIVVPRLLKAKGVDLDAVFVAVVPLGGRHVSHFWRLLTDLAIPFITLLDLDRERMGGGWGRVQYVLKQLRAIGVQIGSDKQIAEMPDWAVGAPGMRAWLEPLEGQAVFFSQPLDLDFAMLRAFPEAYKGTAEGGGPRIPTNPAELATRTGQAVRAVLKDGGGTGETYGPDEKALFPWYSYLFLGKGKPTTHILAMLSLTEDELSRQMPAVLSRLIDSAKGKLGVV